MTAGIRSWSPFWANLHPYAELVRRARRAPDRRAALAVWLRPPEWRAPWDHSPIVAPATGGRCRAPRRPTRSLQLGLAAAAALALLWPGVVTAGVVRFSLAAFVLSALVTVAAYWDGRAWARRAEACRLGMIMGGGIALVLFRVVSADALAAIVALCAFSGGASRK